MSPVAGGCCEEATVPILAAKPLVAIGSSLWHNASVVPAAARLQPGDQAVET